VLGAFCYTGSFEISAAHYGARSVLGLDISEKAIALCEQNASLNGLDAVCTFQCVNAFDVLKGWAKDGRQWDVVMLDPPAFAKNRAAVERALAGYKEINLRALRLLRPGGHLVTCSCSYNVDEGMFLSVLQAAASDAQVEAWIVEKRAQARDHPILLAVPETYYLKCVVVRRAPHA